MPQAEEIPAWLLEMEQPEPELEQPEPEKEELAPSKEAPEWKSDEVPDWLKEIAESTPPQGAPAEVELPAAEEIPPLAIEAGSELMGEIAPTMEVEQEGQEEPQPEAVSWLPEAEQPVEPPSVVPVEAEVTPTPVVEEFVTKTVDTLAAPPEAPVEVTEELPDANQIVLSDARNAINQGLPTQAVEYYAGLIKQNYQLDEIIKDLQDALYRFPVDVDMWVSLGDAHFRSDELQEALNAYTKAEELVR